DNLETAVVTVSLLTVMASGAFYKVTADEIKRDSYFSREKHEEELKKGFTFKDGELSDFGKEILLPLTNTIYKLFIEIPSRPGRNLAYLIYGK
ncbi:MAG: hypothetical protein AABY03_01200, partial [Nanoarchaeota archaeon]